MSQRDLLRARESTERVTKQRVHRVIVVNKAGQLHGVLSAMDVLRVMIRDVCEEGSLD